MTELTSPLTGFFKVTLTFILRTKLGIQSPTLALYNSFNQADVLNIVYQDTTQIDRAKRFCMNDPLPYLKFI